MLFFLALRLVLPDSDDTFARGSTNKYIFKNKFHIYQIAEERECALGLMFGASFFLTPLSGCLQPHTKPGSAREKQMMYLYCTSWEDNTTISP